MRKLIMKLTDPGDICLALEGWGNYQCCPGEGQAGKIFV